MLRDLKTSFTLAFPIALFIIMAFMVWYYLWPYRVERCTVKVYTESSNLATTYHGTIEYYRSGNMKPTIRVE